MQHAGRTATTSSPCIKLQAAPLYAHSGGNMVAMAEEAFAVHNITDNRHKMLEIRMALTQEVRGLTAHLTTGHSNDDLEKLTTYLRKYGARTDVQMLRAMVAKRPTGDKTPTEHLHALRLEFGTKPETLTLLRRIFEDSLAPHIAALLASEKLIDIDSYADRANELYVLYVPNAATTVATVITSEISFCNNELLQALKALTSQVTSLTNDINSIKARSAHEEAQHYADNYEANAVSHQPQASAYRQPP